MAAQARRRDRCSVFTNADEINDVVRTLSRPGTLLIVFVVGRRAAVAAGVIVALKITRGRGIVGRGRSGAVDVVLPLMPDSAQSES